MPTLKPFRLQAEIENLPYAAALFSYMQCVSWPITSTGALLQSTISGHNLARAKAQFKLLQGVEEHAPPMENSSFLAFNAAGMKQRAKVAAKRGN